MALAYFGSQKMNTDLHILSGVLTSALSMAVSAPSVGGCGSNDYRSGKILWNPPEEKTHELTQEFLLTV